MATPHVTTVLILESGNVLASRVVEILSDWHASGWVTDVVVASTEEVISRGADIGNVILTRPASPAAGPERVRMKDLLDELQTRLVVIDPMGADADWVDRRGVLLRASSAISQAVHSRVAAIDVIIPWHGGAGYPGEEDRWHGWDTIVAAPEESISLDKEGIALFCDPANPAKVGELAGHAAAFICTATGLWSGIPGSPFDHTDAVDDLRIGRSVHRRLDASAIADQVRSAALDPRSLRDARALPATGPQELDRRVSAVAPRVRLAPVPPVPAPPPPTAIGLMDTLKLFFSFMWSALKGMPADMLRGAVTHVKEGVANRVQAATFGSNSLYAVTVGGVQATTNADLSAEGQSQMIESVYGAVAGIDGIHMPDDEVGVSQADYWTAVVDETLTLVSGRREGQADDPPQQGGAPRYYKVKELAPPVAGRWKPQGGALSGIPPEGIAPYDVLTARATLRAVERDVDAGANAANPMAAQNRASLVEFVAPWRESFVGRIGINIADRLENELKHFDHILAEADRLGREGRGAREELQRVQKSRMRTTRILTAVGLLLMVLAVALHFTLLPALSLLLVLPVIVMAWLIGMVVTFVRTQKRIFELIHKNNAQQAADDRVLQQLPVVIENAMRLMRVYEQYLVWAPTLSAFLSAPFGRASARQHDLLGMVGSMPKSVACGIYEATDEGQAQQAARQLAETGLRSSVSELWRNYTKVGRDVVVRQQPHLHNVEASDVLAQSEVGEDSFLESWLDAIGTEDASGALRMSDQVAGTLDVLQMDRILEQLRGPGAAALGSLRNHYRVIQVGAGGSAASAGDAKPPADFIAGDFSVDGITLGMARPDLSTLEHRRSDELRQRSTRHWLDELDSSLVFSQQLTFAYLDVKHPEGLRIDDYPVLPSPPIFDDDDATLDSGTVDAAEPRTPWPDPRTDEGPAAGGPMDDFEVDDLEDLL